MTYEQTREAFIRILNENAYTHLCQVADIKNAINAIDKQIPKKPLNPCGRWYGKAKGGNCPVCGTHTTNNVSNFCRKCGQALDWSDTK